MDQWLRKACCSGGEVGSAQQAPFVRSISRLYMLALVVSCWLIDAAVPGAGTVPGSVIVGNVC